MDPPNLLFFSVLRFFASLAGWDLETPQAADHLFVFLTGEGGFGGSGSGVLSRTGPEGGAGALLSV